MKLSYTYGTKTIYFEVLFSNRKTLSIEIVTPGVITVTAPNNTKEEDILNIIKKKSFWIIQKLYEIKSIQHEKKDKEYVNGESFLYLGRNYSLQIIIDESLSKPFTKLLRSKFYVYTPLKTDEMIKNSLKQWYKEKAEEKITERIKYYSSYFDEKPEIIKIKEQKKRWGSCTSKKELLFNWKCIMMPSTVLDYVIIHEMTHLIYMNHSKEFWNMIKKILPDYKERRLLLKNNGIKYEL